MKNLILFAVFAILPSSFLAARSEPVTGSKVLKDVAQKADKLTERVAKATDATAADYCKEDIKHMTREVVKPDPEVPVIACVPDEKSFLVPSKEDFSSFIRDYKIEFYPDATSIKNTRDFRLFMHEFKKFPAPLLKEMADAGGRIRIFVGDGVTVDPMWDQERLAKIQRLRENWAYYNKYGGTRPTMTEADINRGYSTTSEGSRNWDYVSGAGGVFSDPTMILPTRVVVNHLYTSKTLLDDGTVVEWDQGATNLFLHEHAHALDSLYGHHAISSSPQWKTVMNDPQTKIYAEKIFSTYENGFEEEGFAEAFSYYHSCEASRQQMEMQAPALAQFFKNFTTVKELRPDLYQRWRRTYKR